ncbi:MAG: flagellar FliJ family protein [Planctomycetes bacterium]|nr:flagellar FliJ family protein [Planctomycetota bacterium]
MAERFQTLIDFHHQQEDGLRRRLAVLEHERAESVARAAALAATRIASAAQVDWQGREQLARYWMKISADIAAIATATARLDQVIAKVRGELVEVHRQITTFGKLQERDRAAAQQTRARHEARQGDEFAARRWLEAQS